MPDRYFELTDPKYGKYRLYPDVLALPPGKGNLSKSGLMSGVKYAPTPTRPSYGRQRYMDRLVPVSAEEFIPSYALPRKYYGVAGGRFMPQTAPFGLGGEYLGRDIPTDELWDALYERERAKLASDLTGGRITRYQAKAKIRGMREYFRDIKETGFEGIEVASEMDLPIPGQVTKQTSLNMPAEIKYGEKATLDKLRDLEWHFRKKISGTSVKTRKEIVASLYNYRASVPSGKLTDVGSSALRKSLEEGASSAAELFGEGAVSYKNPLDLSKVGNLDIGDEALSRLLARRAAATGEFVSRFQMRMKYARVFGAEDWKQYKKLPAWVKDAIEEELRIYSPVGAKTLWVPGGMSGRGVAGQTFWERVLREEGAAAPTSFDEVNLLDRAIQKQNKLNQIINDSSITEFNATRSAREKARKFITKRYNDGSASVFYGSLPTKKALRRQYAREAMAAREAGAVIPIGKPKTIWTTRRPIARRAMEGPLLGTAPQRLLEAYSKAGKVFDIPGMAIPLGPPDYSKYLPVPYDAKLAATQALKPVTKAGVLVGKPYGPSRPDVSAIRRMRALSAERMAATPGTGRAATQAASALTAINQSIKEKAFLPDIRRPELLIPKGKIGVTFRPFDLPEQLLGKYPGTTRGIDIMVGERVLGKVPYTKGGGLINKILQSRSVAGYIENQGVLSGGQPWARVAILPETAPGKIIPVKNVRVAGITFGDLTGRAEQMTKKAANRTAQLEGSELFKSWMAKIPARYKIGAAAVGITLAAMMIGRKEKARQPLDLVAGEVPDASLYGGLRAGTISPEGMEEEDFRERVGMMDRGLEPAYPVSYSTRIQDPNAIQTNIRIKSGTRRNSDFEAVGRGIGLVASDRSGAELGNVNVRVTDDSRRMNDQYINRKIARLI